MSYIDQACLYTDLYQLRMMQGYFVSGSYQRSATFDYFFRKNPFQGGYVVFAGLQDLLATLVDLHFDADSLAYLKELGFRDDFLAYLKDFQFKGSLLSAREGEVVFPGEPVMRVSGTLLEAQLVETLLLNIINFQSLIATKAARMCTAAQGRTLIDFGLRRAQGLGAIHATRAAIIGGFQGTSNVYAAKRYDVPAIGTMAHSWIQSCDSELQSFRLFVELYGEVSVLLVDTFDTLKSGLPNAITVAKEMQARGQTLKGIRLDSGDLAYFSRKARQMLDDAGLPEVQIVASNQLDEMIIRSLMSQQAPIDIFAVGTRLVTGDQSPALDGVYKLSQLDARATLKISENIEKITLPGKKIVQRFVTEQGMFYADGIGLEDEATMDLIYHPLYHSKSSQVSNLQHEDLMQPVMERGSVLQPQQSLLEMAAWSAERRAQLDVEYRRFDNPHEYKVGISTGLLELQESLIQASKG